MAEYWLTARTKVQLLTGGKAPVNRQSLFCIPVSVTEYGWSLNGQWTATDITNKTSLRVLEKAVGSDGKLWVALPDNSQQNITVTAPAQHYGAWTTPTKYTPMIAARGNGINYDDLSVTNPEFCVGQLLTFWLNWDSTPPYTTADNIWWQLPDKFVNQATNYSPTCPTYVKSQDLLTKATTQCWYVRDPGGACSVREKLHFDNGQSVNIAAAGSFTIYRPKVTFDTNSVAIGPVAVEATGQSYPAAKLTSGGCLFRAAVTSTDFSGQVNWVQLINRHMEGDGLEEILWLRNNTFGNYYLDNDPFYNTIGGSVGTPPTNTPVGPGTIGTIPFGTDGAGDQPEMGIQSTSYLSLTDTFKTYLVFQPNCDSIWVTLGRVDWGWNGYAAFDIPTIKWQLISGSTNSPTYTDTDEFPVWTNIYSNSK